MRTKMLPAFIMVAVMTVAAISCCMLGYDDSDAAIPNPGSASNPLTSLEGDIADLSNYHSGGVYVKVGSYVRITDWDDGDGIESETIESVTPGFGLTLVNGGLLEGTITKTGNITVVSYWFSAESEDWAQFSTTIHAVQPSVTVSFNSMGGSYVAPQTVSVGGYVSQPAAPNNGVKIFGGWYTDEACTQAYNFSTPVNSSFILYAKWTDPTVAITSGHGNDSMKIGDLFEYYITTNPSGASISVTGASWLHVDDHRIYGTPTTAGTYNVTINATSNGYNPAAQSFTITVSSILAPSNSPSNGAIAYVR